MQRTGGQCPSADILAGYLEGGCVLLAGFACKASDAVPLFCTELPFPTADGAQQAPWRPP
jgi:hypothetical protein